MHICIVTNAAKASLAGNRITANRWARIFRQIGHRVTIDQKFHADCDMLIGIHAEKSVAQVNEFLSRYPYRQVLIVISGTDLYGQTSFSAAAKKALDAADGLVVLEGCAMQKLPAKLQLKTTIIHQSANPPKTISEPLKSCFEVSVCGHLRPEKDPFLAAKAIHLLPESSRIKVSHVGKALSADMKRNAEKLNKSIERYRWLGGKEHWKARQLVARSRLMVNTSKMESSANSIIEAVVAGVPVLATNVAGNVGVFGSEYVGLFPVGDAHALATLLFRAETDKKFYNLLSKQCKKVAKTFSFENEFQTWCDVLASLGQ